MKINLLFILTAITGIVAAQGTFDLDWNHAIGGSNNQYCNDIISVGDDNIFTVGAYEGTVDFDPGISVDEYSSNGLNDIYIQRVFSTGVYEETITIGGSGDDAALAISHASFFNELFVTGYFSNTVDFDPGPDTNLKTAEGDKDIFVAKYSTSGDLIWVQTFGSDGLDQGTAIYVSPYNEDIYVAGQFSGSVDFDPSVVENIKISEGLTDAFIVKLSTNDGGLLWLKTIGGIGVEEVEDIYASDEGWVSLCGNFDSETDFSLDGDENIISPEGEKDFFLMRLEDNGDIDWFHTMGGLGNDRCYSVSSDNYERIYIGGSYEDNVDFDPGTGVSIETADALDGFVACYSLSSGDLIWVETIGGSGNDEVSYLINNGVLWWDGSITITGTYENTIDADPGVGVTNLSVSEGDSGGDVFIIQLDEQNGAYVNSGSVGGPGEDTATGVIDFVESTESTNIYLAGTFEETADHNPNEAIVLNETSSGEKDQFLLGIISCDFPISGNLNQIVSYCEITPDVPTVGTECALMEGTTDAIFPITSLGTTTVNWVFEDPFGNIYNVAQNILIQEIDASISESANVLSVESNDDLSYIWVDCNDGNTLIPFATDNSYAPTVSGSYAVEISSENCTVISDCFEIDGLNISETALASSIQLYPNPGNGILHLDWGHHDAEMEITIVDILGRKVHQSQLFGSAAKIKLDEADGYYLIKIKNSAGQTASLSYIKNGE